MGDHVVVNVDGLTNAKDDGVAEKPSDAVTAPSVAVSTVADLAEEDGREDEPLIQAAECRICQEEDSIKNLEKPCTCNGSLKYAHRACVQRWCNEKGDITCEICHEQYKPGYTAPPRVQPDETTIDIRQVCFSILIFGDWTITGAPLDLRDPRILAVAAAQRRLLEAEYDEYGGNDANGAAFCRSAALILMALLLLRHALSISDNEGDDDASTMFSLFLLRAAGFLLPCYIMAWIFSILHRRRQREEASAIAAAEVAFILQSAQGRALQFTIAPDSPTTPQHEPHQQQQPQQ
ncbi:hypothetical protein ACQ4PT_067011 [Festuca glaucescens]